MKKVYLLFISLFTLTCLSAQTLFHEDFEAGTVPAGWTMKTVATDGGWKVGTPGSLSSTYYEIPGNGSARVAATNDDACNCDKRNEYFISPPIDLSGVTDVVLSFDTYYLDNNYQGAQEHATVELSEDAVNWTVLEDLHGHGSWDKHFIDLSAYAGKDSIFIGFRYHDSNSWLYGFSIDNVVVEVPPVLDVALIEINSPIYGEVNREMAIQATVFNNGITTVESLELAYTTNGGTPVVATIDNLNIPPFSYQEVESPSAWVPDAPGEYTLIANINQVNGASDENVDNNSGEFEPEIFEQVIVPNKMELFLNTYPEYTEVANSSNFLNRPTDLDFFPINGKDELWVINQRNESSGGTTLTISDATVAPGNFQVKTDGNAWHFMSLPTALAFSNENFNFASSPGVKDANHDGGTFTGPTLWSSDPEIYAQPSGGNGSHLDMLHGSPFSMGIAHEIDNVFWVYDNWNKDIVRYDFVDDHGPGNDDHSDAIVRRYQNLGIKGDGDIPNHMVLDKSTGWLYFVDNGNDRVVRLDINSGSVGNAIPLINEPLAEHSAMTGYNFETIIDSGLEQPCGIEIFENYLLVGDYATGDIVVYDLENNFTELGRIPTEGPGITGIKVGPDGNIWFTNRTQNRLLFITPGNVLQTNSPEWSDLIKVSPNPSSGMIQVALPESAYQSRPSLNLMNSSGQVLLNRILENQFINLDLSERPNGVYFLQVSNDRYTSTKRIILQR